MKRIRKNKLLKALKIMFYILSFPILGCNSNKVNPQTKIGNFIFLLPKGTNIYYNTKASTEDEIVFNRNFTANFSKGYFNPIGYSHIQGNVLMDDTIGDY